MQFKNHSRNTLKVVGAAGASVAKGPGVRHLTRKYVSQTSESGRPTASATQTVGVEIDPEAVFDVPEEYAMPRLVRGMRHPGPFEEMVGCPGCKDPAHLRKYVEQTVNGEQEKEKHVEHPTCLPVDAAELAMWLQAPTVQKDPNRLSDFERQTQLIQEQSSLKDENEQLRARLERLEALLSDQTAPKPKAEKRT